jgi:hypothetical protein
MDRNGVVLDGEFRRTNGIRVLGADSVTIENMTARRYVLNGFYWTGVDGYRGSYLTAYNDGDYGIYAIAAALVVPVLGPILLLRAGPLPHPRSPSVDAGGWRAGGLRPLRRALVRAGGLVGRAEGPPTAPVLPPRSPLRAPHSRRSLRPG